jgi:hypothetical protein
MVICFVPMFFLGCKRLNVKEHEYPQEQMLKEKFKSNFQTRNKIRLCDSKTKIQELRIRIENVQDKHENGYLLC